MDRRAWKAAAREDVALKKDSAVLITQVYLALILALMILNLCVTLLLRHFGASGNYLSDTVSAGQRNYLIQMLFSLFCRITQTLLSAGYTFFALQLIRRKTSTLDALWSGFRRPGRVIWLSVLQGIFITLWVLLFSFLLGLIYTPISAAILGSTISDTGSAADMEAMRQALLSPPSLAAIIVYFIALMALVIFVSYRYNAAYFLLMDYPQLTAHQALKLSVAITKGHRWKLFVLDLSFLPWFLLGYLTLGILFIWKLPYIEATRARAYRAIMDDYGQRRKDLNAHWDHMWLKEPTGGPGQE